MFVVNREEVAWASGFYDGEGSCYISRKGGSLSPILSIGQADPEPLHRFMTAFGIGSVYGPYDYAKTNRKPSYHYMIQGFEGVQAIIAMMWTFLCTPKRYQATEVMREVVPYAKAMVEKALCCPRGHAMTEENTHIYIQGRGWKSRRCRTCMKEQARVAYERRRTEQAEMTEMLRVALNGDV